MVAVLKSSDWILTQSFALTFGHSVDQEHTTVFSSCPDICPENLLALFNSDSPARLEHYNNHHQELYAKASLVTTRYRSVLSNDDISYIELFHFEAAACMMPMS